MGEEKTAIMHLLLICTEVTQHFCLHLIGRSKSCGRVIFEFNRAEMGMCQSSAGIRVRTIIQPITAAKDAVVKSITNSHLCKQCPSGYGPRLAGSWHSPPHFPKCPAGVHFHSGHTKQESLRPLVAVTPVRLAAADLWPSRNPSIC